MRSLWRSLNAWRWLVQEWLAGAWPAPARKAPGPAVVSRHTVRLGHSSVELVVRGNERGGLRYLNLHENEQTSVEAAAALLAHGAGTLIELRSRRRRLVAFWIGWRPHVFDPNRIYTDAGLEQTLRQFASWTPAARAAVQALRDAVLALIDGAPDEPIVALHNNGAGRYSIHAYELGGEHAADALAVAVGSARASEDFFLVTRRPLFEHLRERGFNVVLQTERPGDDGSLSVWFGRQRRAYVNVEALHGHLHEQQRMLEAVAAWRAAV